MEFREYLENEQKLELYLFEEIYQQDPEWMNRTDESIMDIVKGTGRFIKGAAQTGSGIMSMGDEALARMMGDPTKGRMKGGWDRLAKGVGNMGGGVKQAIVGTPQKPQSQQQIKIPQEAPQAQQPQAPQKQQAQPQKKEPLKFKVGKQETLERGLESLINQYKAARDSGERNRILATIAMRHPKWYQTKLNQARNRQFARAVSAG